MRKKPDHPMQPVYQDERGVMRFWPNRIVRYLLDNGGIDMNKISYLAAMGTFTKADQEQFAQLIGYSVSGAGDLDYVSKALIKKADAAVEELRAK